MAEDFPSQCCGYTDSLDRSRYCKPEVEDEHIEEILVGLGDASDGWYRPTYERYLPPRKRFCEVRVPQAEYVSPPHSPISPVHNHPRTLHNAQSDHVYTPKKRSHTPPYSPEDEPKLVESSDEKENDYISYSPYDDELELEPKRKLKKMRVVKNSENSNNDEEGGICGKTNKPRTRKEYFYSKNSKTIFRWTCCGSQAKDHPDF